MDNNISAICTPIMGGNINITYNQFGEETLQDDLFKDFEWAPQSSRINTLADNMDDSLFLNDEGGAEGFIFGGTH